MLATSLLMRQKIAGEEAQAIIERAGGAAAFAIQSVWNTGRPNVVGVTEDAFLLGLPHQGDYGRVNVHSGETLLLYATQASMSPDGTILYRSRLDNALYQLPPDTALGVPLENRSTPPLPFRLLSDGGFWHTETVLPESGPQSTGKKPSRTQSLAFVRRDAGGAELERIDGEHVLLGRGPDTLSYCEEAGVGVAFSNATMCVPLFVFHTGDEAARVLTVGNPSALLAAETMLQATGMLTEAAVQGLLAGIELKETALNEALDEEGKLTADTLPLFFYSVSAAGDRMLALELNSGFMLWVKPGTWEMSVAATYDQLQAAFESQGASYSSAHLTTCSWNGIDLLCGAVIPEGFALRVGGAGSPTVDQ